MARITKDPQIRMAEILDTAEAMFNTMGYHKTAISDIVKEIGVAQGTFYYYFKSKEEVLEALVYRHFSAKIAEAEAIVNNKAMNAIEKIDWIIRQAMSCLNTEGGLLFEYLYTDEHMHILDKVGRQGQKTVMPTLLTVIEEGVQQGIFHVSCIRGTADFIFSIFRCMHEAVYNKYPPEEMQQRATIAKMLLEKALGMEEGVLSFDN
ncbi:MAG: transcriptional regulator, TetR family [Firmicutes bacterium]|nr:transcriptional regulator, TetR family [Bacillota bacterium]